MPDLNVNSNGAILGFEMEGKYTHDNTAYTSPEGDSGGEARKRNVATDHEVQVQEIEEQKPDDINLSEEDLDFEDLEINPGACMKVVSRIQTSIGNFFTQHGKTLQIIFYCLLLCGFIAYFSYAMYYERLEGIESITLLWVTCLVFFICVIYFIRRKWGDKLYGSCIEPVVELVEKKWTIFSVIFCLLVAIAFAVIVGYVIGTTTPYNLVSLAGGLIFVTLGFIFSTNPKMVRWRVVLWGLGLQFTFALVILRTVWGFEAFRWLGDLIFVIIEFVDAGVVFVFGDAYVDHYFAMRVMPVVIYFCAAVAILYHWGAIQVFVEKFGWLMEVCVGTTAGESTAAAANVFLGMNESPMLIAPLLGRMTDSEIHCVLVGGFATIAGSIMATFIALGIPGNHILSASIISAPCALAMSKLFKPETKKTKFSTQEKIEFTSLNYRNSFDAACQGAINGIYIVGCIIGNLIAFLSLLALLDGLLGWLGHRVGIEDPSLSFELIMSYVLWPAAFCLGIPSNDCFSVAKLLGTKMFVNEFVAYMGLIDLMKNGAVFREHIADNGTYEYMDSDIWLVEPNITLSGGVISRRSEVISTYALCGFANIGSIGILLGSFTSLVPRRAKSIPTFILRAMIAGTMTSYLTACTAGLLYDPEIEEVPV